MRKLNERMANLPRAEDFNLPLCGGQYVGGHTMVQAREHRMVMQILPHLLHGIDDIMARVSCK